MSPLKIFVSYAHKDRKAMEALSRALAALRRDGSLALWTDGEIDPGGHFNRDISQQIDAADVFVCLVTKEFLSSEYCVGVELQSALDRQRTGTLTIVPVILKPCDWQRVFDDIEALPRDGMPICDRKWGTADAAYTNVVEGLAKLAGKRHGGTPVVATVPQPESHASHAGHSVPATEVSDRSKYARYRIAQIFKERMREQGLNIDNLDLERGMHVQDVEVLCQRLYFTDRAPDAVRKAIDSARGIAFATKYAEPHEDEKLLDPREIKLPGLQRWEDYFAAVLSDLGFASLDGVDLLDVGAGNGWAVRSLYQRAGRIRAADLSELALERFAAAQARPVDSYLVAAERLDGIENGSVQLYLSFRTFQSSLFHRRGAIQEAFRVIEYGGGIILSVPTMFLTEDRQVLRGLIPPGSKTPDEAYARRIVEELLDSMTALNFRDVKVNDTSPFETYVYARHP